MKSRAKSMREWKDRLARNELSEFVTYLSSDLTAVDLTAIREQKLLVVATDENAQKTVADAYAAAVEKNLIGNSQSRGLNYAAFSTFFWHRVREISREFDQRSPALEQVSREEVFDLVAEFARELVNGVEDARAVALNAVANESLPARVETSEYLAHEYVGLTNDAWWALMRALNELAKRVAGNRRRAGRRLRERARNELRAVWQTAYRWNDIQYLFDQVSYGHWEIRHFEVSERVNIVFDVCDPALERARMVGIRRHHSNMTKIAVMGNPGPRVLKGFAVTAAIAAASCCLQEMGRSPPVSMHRDLEMNAARLLDAVREFDALIFGAADGDEAVKVYYFCGLLLAASMVGVMVVAESFDRSAAAKIRRSGLPLAFYRRFATSQRWPEDVSRRAIEELVSSVPARNYFELVQRPYLRIDGRIRMATEVTAAEWPVEVRRALMSGGALATRFGSLWERQVGEIFRRHGWEVLSQGMKLRESGTTVTDIDLLIFKENLLLVVQCKAIGVGADCIYTQWLARSKVLHGVEQALLACAMLEQRPQVLKHVLHGKNETGVRVQPLVITSTGLFTGWNPQGVPIASLDAVATNLQGAAVSYRDENGKVLGTQKHIAGLSPTAEEFLDLLSFPVDWRIAGHSGTIIHRAIDSENLRVWLPEIGAPVTAKAAVSTKSVAVSSGPNSPVVLEGQR